MRIYLDNCCFNRPYDDQSQIRIHIETLSKMRIQKEIMEGKHQLITSIVLDYENSRNRDGTSSSKIQAFMDTYSSEYVDEKMFTSMKPLRDEIIKEGIKFADASHLACAIHSNCDFFITTDDRILKYRGDRIKVISPVDFIVVKEE